MSNFSFCKWLAIAALCLATLAASAQKVEYYRWTKTYYKDGRVENTTGNKGQFVTRNGKACYDSDKQGYSVGNGSLKLVTSNGNDSKYSGKCYYGDYCTYTFFGDRGLLNIQDVDGNVYVYKLATPPSGRTTSSLIAKHESTPPPATYTPVAPSTSSSRSSSSSSSSSTYNRYKKTHPKECRFCHGTGVCSTCAGRGSWLPYVGAKAYRRCPNCNGSGRCSHCNGTGYNGYY